MAKLANQLVNDVLGLIAKEGAQEEKSSTNVPEYLVKYDQEEKSSYYCLVTFKSWPKGKGFIWLPRILSKRWPRGIEFIKWSNRRKWTQ